MKRPVWIVTILVLAYVAFDLLVPRHADLRRIDAVLVGGLETQMWQSYYGNRPARLFWQLGELMRAQYGMPPLRSMVAAYYAARAALVFKRGYNRAEYERALPPLHRYFATIRNSGNIPFGVERAARLELEWWIIHREHLVKSPADDLQGPLDEACTAAAAELYQTSAARLAQHGHLRAEAMRLRDRRAAEGRVSQDDWRRIDSLLVRSYRALQFAVTGHVSGGLPQAPAVVAARHRPSGAAAF